MCAEACQKFVQYIRMNHFGFIGVFSTVTCFWFSVFSFNLFWPHSLSSNFIQMKYNLFWRFFSNPYSFETFDGKWKPVKTDNYEDDGKILLFFQATRRYITASNGLGSSLISRRLICWQCIFQIRMGRKVIRGTPRGTLGTPWDPWSARWK